MYASLGKSKDQFLCSFMNHPDVLIRPIEFNAVLEFEKRHPHLFQQKEVPETRFRKLLLQIETYHDLLTGKHKDEFQQIIQDIQQMKVVD